ncbi:MAG: hypothetical protein HKN98_14305 [Silicimonas sp.]|nr:hypothetical protein [Silicimonas sp.]
MRLICPNCSAEYEIDASLIPDEGRDVQCSNCGHTWFELPPAPPAYADAPEPDEAMLETEAEAAQAVDPPEPQPDARQEPEPETEPEEEVEAQSDPEPEPEPASEPEPEPKPEPESALEPEPNTPDDVAASEDKDDEPRSPAARAFTEASEKADVDTGESDPFAAAAAAGAALQRRKPVDDDALEILREEAERELSQRRAPPTAPLETQTDMPLENVEQRRSPSRALRARMARTDSEDAAHQARDAKSDPRVQSVDDGYEAPRRDLLPDIDEINSSLKSRKKRDTASPEAEADARKGFRSGFLLMVGLAVLMILAYAWAPIIARAVPALETPLLVYVDTANGVRDWIDGLVGG